MDEKSLELIYEKLSDKWWRLNNLYYIKDKNGRKVLFRPNIDQETFFKNMHGLDIVLKARQKGFTTLACIDALDDVLFNDYFEAGIIAHTVDDAEKIFTNKVKFAYDNLHDWLKKRRKPNTDKAGMLRFPNNSAISVDTSFRGGTLQRLHVSEYGKICKKYPEKAREIKSGAFEAVGLGNRITVESTAEGMSGDFYKMCERAQLKDPKRLTQLDFKFHFFAWWESEEYRLDPTFVDIPKEYTDYFEELERDHEIKLDDHQKAWYVKKAEEKEGDMKQEYPSYPEEAFLASGRPVFAQSKIVRAIRIAKAKSLKRGFLSDDGKFSEDPNGTLIVYQMPVPGKAYAVAGDPAEGLEDGDNSAASVLDKDFNQCAVYAGKMDPDTFGEFLVKLGKFYNNAVIAPEVNNHGHAVISAIKRKKYFKIYKRDGAAEELGVDVLDKVGWHNNVKTKMQMLDELKGAFRDDVIKINCEATLREMMTVVYEEDGNIIVKGKDRTVCLGISIQAIKQATTEGQHKAKVPGKNEEKDLTKMTIEEKLKYYNRMQRK